MKVINGEKWYFPKEVAKLRLITNAKESDKMLSNYEHILRLIRTKKLIARNWGIAGKYWIVSEKEINRYNEQMLLK